MSQNFYTYAWQYGNSILVRGVRNGKRFTERHPFTPTLYVKSAEPTQFKSIDGQSLKPIEFGDNSDCKEFLENYSKVENYPIYGQTDLTYQYLSSMYPNEISFDMSQMKILSIDIETTAQHGFPDVENPIEEVLLISVIDNATKEIHTWGSGEWKCVSDEVRDLPVNYTYCSDEYDLLQNFMGWWANNYPEVITGWNIEQFDMPYLVNRIDRIFGGDSKNILSPYNMTRKRMVRGHNREILKVDIKGIIQLDYMDLYKKFTYTFQES